MSLPVRPSFELNTHSMTSLSPRGLEEWDELARVCRQPLAGASLLTVWLDATARLQDSVLIEVRFDGNLIAALPLTRRRGTRWGWPRRVVTPATTLDLPTLDPLLIMPTRGSRGPQASVVLDALVHAAMSWAANDALVFDGLGPESPLTRALEREGFRRGTPHQRQPSRTAAQIDLSDGFESMTSRCSLARQRAVAAWRNAHERSAFEICEVREIDSARASVIEVLQIAKRSPAAAAGRSLACSAATRQFVRTALLAGAVNGSMTLQLLRIDGRAEAFAWFVVGGGHSFRLASAACDGKNAFDLSGPLAAEGLRRFAARGIRQVFWCDELSGADTGWVFERPAAVSLKIGSSSPLSWLGGNLSLGES
ncbi:MAG: hypothetical protein U0V87_03735 [Acidobacteriota bacterium]